MTSAPQHLTVASYNLYLGADLSLLFGARSIEELAAGVAVVRDQLQRTDFGQRAAAIARVLVCEQVDVVGLQEVSQWAGGPGEDVVDFLPVLLDALAALATPYDVHAVSPSFAGGLPVDGSRMSVSGANVVLVRRGGPFRVTGARTGTFDAVFIVSTALEGVTFPIRRGWSVVEGDVAGAPFVFAATHTEAYDPATRDAQRDEVLVALGDPGCPVALVGDFNAVPAEVGVGSPYVDAWVAAGNDPEAGPTCGQAPDLSNEVSALAERIDYVFVRDAEVTACALVGDTDDDRTVPGRLWPSDHAGVVARLAF